MQLKAQALKQMVMEQLEGGPTITFEGDKDGCIIIAFVCSLRPKGTISVDDAGDFLVSMGEKLDGLDPLDVREVVGAAIVSISKLIDANSKIAISLEEGMDYGVVARAVRLALLRPGILKSKSSPEPIAVVNLVPSGYDATDEVKDAVTWGDTVARYENVARLLALVPPNHLTVDVFRDLVYLLLVGETGVSLQQPDNDEPRKMELARAVCAASEIPPSMISIRIQPESGDTENVLAIAGKGLVFDSGGLCLKPLGGRGMKHDKTGACVALALALWAARNRRDLTTTLVVGLAIAENAIGRHAYRVDDVYTGYNGKTVEIDNTDAEGRLVLFDLMAWMCDRFQVRTIIPVCTLTGAAVVGVGRWATALHVRGSRREPEKKTLAERIRLAGLKVADPVNLLEEPGSHVAEQMSSDIADLKNSSGGDRNGGSQQGFYFLCQSVPEGVDDVIELDIAGSVDCDAKGGAGVQKGTTRPAGVALLIEMIKEGTIF